MPERCRAPEEKVTKPALKDRGAERCVLGACIREPDRMFPKLDEMEFTPDSFTAHCHVVLFGELKEMWCRFQKITLVSVWARLRVMRVLAEFGHCPALWLAETFQVYERWWDVTREWWADEDTGVVGLGLAAAAKVKWLASRRHAIYRAEQVLKDATDGVAESFDDEL